MKISLTAGQRVFIIVVCFTTAIIGFMIKLPSGLSRMDKELHTAFYFLAAALLNILFAGIKIVRHITVFIALYVFGMAIEYAQGYSNRFFRSPIHGRFDPEDVQANLKGLICFSLLWFFCTAVIVIYKSVAAKKKEPDSHTS